MATKIQLRRDTKANWETADPILMAGEVALETDTRRHKIGNGTDTYTALPYALLNETFSATITTTWTGAEAPFSQVVSIPGLLATDNPIVDIDLSGALDYEAEGVIKTEWAKIYRIVAGLDQITVYADTATTEVVPIQLKVVR